MSVLVSTGESYSLVDSLTVKIVRLRASAKLPEYQTAQAAAMDIHACIDKPITLQSLDRVMVPTGFALELPDGYEAQMRARSGLAIKNGITMANGIGTIDADYRGEVGVLVINTSRDEFVIEPGMRIAQMVVARYERVEWEETNTLSETERGTGGYGSTGTRSSVDTA